MVAAFAAQFESDGKGGYLYRDSERGAAIPVSAIERDAFVATYDRQSRRSLIGLTVVTIAAIVAGVLVGMALHLGTLLQGVAFAVSMVAIVTAIMVMTHRTYGAPRRALAGRASVGVERSRREARDIARARQSWGQILGVFAGFVGSFAAPALRYDALHGWGRLWLLLLAFGVMACGYAAIRKWQIQAG
ncbi:MAG: hypothetical protein JWN66_3963 [Sphingomonas bacterium]|nr:hypothetical protein [Sphingomonas bacterium]MDB5706847.1 hypothetical protein [Sphingomonas bacterium]MDB5708717.1 hypothetical protein [Sphingomonas bacterium]